MFGLDMMDVCASPWMGKTGMTPVFYAWVDISILEDVQTSDVLKFDWRLVEEEPQEDLWASLDWGL